MGKGIIEKNEVRIIIGELDVRNILTGIANKKVLIESILSQPIYFFDQATY